MVIWFYEFILGGDISCLLIEVLCVDGVMVVVVDIVYLCGVFKCEGNLICLFGFGDVENFLCWL